VGFQTVMHRAKRAGACVRCVDGGSPPSSPGLTHHALLIVLPLPPPRTPDVSLRERSSLHSCLPIRVNSASRGGWGRFKVETGAALSP